MTPKQTEILAKHRSRLQTSFADALTALTTPGQARGWFIRYLGDILATYTKLRARRVNGSRLSNVVAKGSRGAIKKLINKTCNRDRRTKSRWAAAVHAAYKAGIAPDEFADWLAKGGGVSGRARKSPAPAKRLAGSHRRRLWKQR